MKKWFRVFVKVRDDYGLVTTSIIYTKLSSNRDYKKFKRRYPGSFLIAGTRDILIMMKGGPNPYSFTRLAPSRIKELTNREPLLMCDICGTVSSAKDSMFRPCAQDQVVFLHHNKCLALEAKAALARQQARSWTTVSHHTRTPTTASSS